MLSILVHSIVVSAKCQANLMHDGPLLVTVCQLDADSIQIAIYMSNHVYASKVLQCMHTYSMTCLIYSSQVMTGVSCNSLQKGHEEDREAGLH